jgi:DNA polymerase III subunit delta'
MMIIGHKKQRLFLEKSLENNLLAHAYLFYGPSKVGKKTIALEFIKNIQPAENYFSNFVDIEPKRIEDKQNAKITIDDIKNLKTRFALSAMGESYKVAIINNAQAMTLDAQGAILKLLEEPRGKSIIFLIVENPHQLLNTIVSRCQSIGFNLVSKEILRTYLKEKGLKDREQEIALWFSFGKPGRLIDYFEKDGEIQLQKKMIKDIKNLIQAPFFKRFKIAEELSKDKEEALKVLNIWLHYFRELLLKKLKKERLSKNYSFKQLKDLINGIERTRYLFNNSNINARLALEFLFLKI